MPKFTVPNWAQALIAKGAGLDPSKVVVRHEDERNISFVQHNPRKDILINKVSGSVTETMDLFADKPKRPPICKVSTQTAFSLERGEMANA